MLWRMSADLRRERIGMMFINIDASKRAAAIIVGCLHDARSPQSARPWPNDRRKGRKGRKTLCGNCGNWRLTQGVHSKFATAGGIAGKLNPRPAGRCEAYCRNFRYCPTKSQPTSFE